MKFAGRHELQGLIRSDKSHATVNAEHGLVGFLRLFILYSPKAHTGHRYPATPKLSFSLYIFLVCFSFPFPFPFPFPFLFPPLTHALSFPRTTLVPCHIAALLTHGDKPMPGSFYHATGKHAFVAPYLFASTSRVLYCNRARQNAPFLTERLRCRGRPSKARDTRRHCSDEAHIITPARSPTPHTDYKHTHPPT